MITLPILVAAGWIAMPFMKGLFYPVLALTIFLIWTKMTETIVAQRGSLPDLYQCYLKALNCFKRHRIPVDEKIPKVISEAAEVVFSTQSMYDFEALTAPNAPLKLVDNGETKQDTQTQSSPPSSAPSGESADEQDNDEGAPVMGSASFEATGHTEGIKQRKIGSSSTPTSSSSTSPSSSSSPVPISSTSQSSAQAPHIRRLIAMMGSAKLSFQPTFLLVPTHNMDMSVLTFYYFPLSISQAALCASDFTILRPVNRKIPLDFSTSITTSFRHKGDIYVNVETIISAKEACSTSSPSSPSSSSPNQPHSGQTLTRPAPLPFARIMNTYVFMGADGPTSANSKDSTTLNEADSKSFDQIDMISRSVTEHFSSKREDMSSSSSSANGGNNQAMSYHIPAALPPRFANISGNIHPRHLSPFLASLFGEEGLTLDPILLFSYAFDSALAIHGSSIADVSNNQLKYPIRAMLRIRGLRRAPTDIRCCVGSITSSPDFIVGSPETLFSAPSPSPSAPSNKLTQSVPIEIITTKGEPCADVLIALPSGTS